MSSDQLSLFDDARGGGEPPSAPAREDDASRDGHQEREALESPARAADEDSDASARRFAVDPRQNVVLEASAGTGKTSVLVTRYVNLLKAGVEPANILAITFTRKAAAEMRERIVRELRESAARSEFDKARWVELRDRLGEIGISTIDAFCLALLREFPLEADLDPGFDIADETEIPRLVDEALDRAMRIFAKLTKEESDVGLVLAQLGVARTREGLATLLERRLVAGEALNRFLAHGPSDLTSAVVCRRVAVALEDALRTVPGGLAQFLAEGPVHHPRFELFAREVRAVPDLASAPEPVVRGRLDRIAAHFLTQEGKARIGGTLNPYKADDYPSPEAARRHRAAVFQIAPHIERVVFAFNRDLNVVLARGIRRMFAIALAQYRRALDERSVLDFTDVLERALELLRRMDEFSQSRFRLEARYHHVLVDEFQDTSRAQWELVSLLVKSWGEGLGVAASPSIFIVGDRKQSIYRFRDAEVAVLQEAGRHIESLRPGASPRRSISRSFRAVPELLAFVNDVFTEMGQRPARADDFAYRDEDRFPVNADAPPSARGPALGIGVGEDPAACAAAVAAEIDRILREDSVRDRQTGVTRHARPGDIAILFRSRSSHREFERELTGRGIPTYVYKGLGFFDADEIKDLTALLRYLADPTSDLRAAAFLRSRFVALSDSGLARLAPRIAASLVSSTLDSLQALAAEDRRVLAHVRMYVHEWLSRVDLVPPADLLESLIRESAYAYELRGARRRQAWENLKKMRGLVRRIQNRGYATLARIADHVDALTAGDESNAVLEALDAVNLMTVHASKGLEFPIVFVVNLAKGASGPPKPIRVIVDGDATPSVSVGPFVSEMEEADREREKHETRRLLYVALTRARDRLYLSSVLKDGVLVPGRGSLAEVFPDSLRGLFAHAATAFPEISTVAWSGSSGGPFEWRLVRPPLPGSDLDRCVPGSDVAPLGSDLDRCAPVPDVASPALKVVARTTASRERGRPRDFRRGIDPSVPSIVTVTAWLAAEGAGRVTGSAVAGDALVGSLVHRMLQSAAGETSLELEDVARALLTSEERATVDDVQNVIAQAIAAYESLRARPDVVALLSGGIVMREVPFSMRIDGLTEFDLTAAPQTLTPDAQSLAPARNNQDLTPGGRTVLRGRIDLLVVRDDGSVVVVEFKTGRRRPEHERQLEIYVGAARALFPGRAVEGCLVYP